MADDENISPELLAATAHSPSPRPPSATAVGEYYALDAISRQKSPQQALEGLGKDQASLVR